MPEPSNYTRITWAAKALDAFGRETGQSQENGETDEMVTDLLCDLMHLCRARNLLFDVNLKMARKHYQEEINIPDHLNESEWLKFQAENQK